MSCIFCEIAIDTGARKNPEDQILDTRSSFYAKPALGHFVEGYTLLISKIHYLTFSEMTAGDLSDLEEYEDVWIKTLKAMYRTSVIAFEHGEVNPSHHAGCCIEHAHLHLLPLPQDISEELKVQFAWTNIQDFTHLSKCKQEKESYLFYESPTGVKFVFSVNRYLPSQFLRRVICEKMGRPGDWDWRDRPFREQLDQFVKSYHELRSAASSISRSCDPTG